MSERRRGLGRGLGALLPSAPPAPDHRGASPVDLLFRDRAGAAARTASEAEHTGTASDGEASNGLRDVPRGTDPEPLVEVSGARFAELPVDAITPNARQPRQVFDEDAMAELVASIREVGLLQPIVVRAAGAGRYELVMGERRWRATQAAGLATIPAIVRSTSDDAMLRDALLENLHRSQLNPLEEAAAYQQLLDDFGCTQEVLAARIGRSRPQVSNTMRLLKLPAPVQRRVAAGVLSAGHARALLGLPDAAAQERLAHRIVAEGLSVRAVEEIVMLGGDPDPEPRRPGRGARAARPVAPRLADIAALLSDRLDTRVKVDLGRSKGKVTIEFASIDDLERIVGSLAASAEARPSAEAGAGTAEARPSAEAGGGAAEARPSVEAGADTAKG